MNWSPQSASTHLTPHTIIHTIIDYTLHPSVLPIFMIVCLRPSLRTFMIPLLCLPSSWGCSWEVWSQCDCYSFELNQSVPSLYNLVGACLRLWCCEIAQIIYLMSFLHTQSEVSSFDLKSFFTLENLVLLLSFLPPRLPYASFKIVFIILLVLFSFFEMSFREMFKIVSAFSSSIFSSIFSIPSSFCITIARSSSF